MRHPALEKLLVLQDRDQRRLGLEAQLASLPAEIAEVEGKIATERGAIDSARAEHIELEVRKKSLETEIGSIEARAGKYRTQQLEVRKNDEYQALGHEIETAQKAVAELEERELEVMFAIDGAKKKFAHAEAEMKANIVGHETRIRTLREREVGLRTELVEAREALAAARIPLDPPALRLYDRIATNGQPVCVAIHDGKCGGCHLKVSGEADSVARKGDQLATCDQCGRIVWWEA